MAIPPRVLKGNPVENKKSLTIKEAIEREKPLSEYVNYILRLGALVVILSLVIKRLEKPPHISTFTWIVTNSISWPAVALFSGLALFMLYRFQKMNEAIVEAWLEEGRSRHPIILFVLGAFPSLAGAFMVMSAFAALNAR